MSLEVKNAHRQAFKEIFSMKAVEGKLDKKGLADLFIMIDYKIPQEQFDEMVQRIFGKKEQIGFEEFLKIFNLKLTDYTFNDVRNAFKLLAKDDDRYCSSKKFIIFKFYAFIIHKQIKLLKFSKQYCHLVFLILNQRNKCQIFLDYLV